MKAKDIKVGETITAVFDDRPFEVVITSKAWTDDTVMFTAEKLSWVRVDDTNFEEYSFEFEVDKDEEEFIDIPRYKIYKKWFAIDL